MATITFHDQTVHTEGELPRVGSQAPDFQLVTTDLATISSKDFQGKKVVLNIFPSIDTGVCAASVRRFHKEATAFENAVIICVSKDLPFAMKRFCGAEGIDNLVMASDFRGDFSKNYKLSFTDSPLKGLLSRSIVVLDEKGQVIHTEQVSETTNEPNYDAVLAVLK